MLTLQKFLFEDEPTRRMLLDYSPGSGYPLYRIGVYRNHSFELIEHTIKAYLDYAEMSVEFVYSDYDDSLSFFNLDLTTDLLILWLDLSRYCTENLENFLQNRIRYLENIYPKPILVVPFEGTLALESERVVCFELDLIKNTLRKRFLDKRLENFSGTKMSAVACMQVSEQLGLCYFPALLRPPLKAIVVDLDNTLYHGVLGEDGTDALALTQGHLHLQQRLKKLAEHGAFLCVASKNDERDVLALFDRRKDFPLKKEDFTKICANWNSKSQSIAEIAEFLNINCDSILFIDDNLGELSEVQRTFPQIKQIHALEDAEITCKILSMFPGLLRLRAQKEDLLRKKDVQANEARKRMKEILSPDQYIRSLGMKLKISFNCPEQATRVAELANKTNQFIFSYRRYNLAEITALLEDSAAAVITASLSDKLSDSGIVGICVALKRPTYVEIEECFVSCRALGRGIDEVLVLGMMRLALEHFDLQALKVDFVTGERNEPARRFVEANLQPYLETAQKFNCQVPHDLVEMEIIKY